ncbi:MAG: hypothetical protein ACOYMG_18335 [Candidatus Methylumidiphilus sp.]
MTAIEITQLNHSSILTRETTAKDAWRTQDVSQLPPISENLVPGSEKLFLFFGGLVGSIGMFPFEFYRSAQILDHSKIFFRDIAQAWYQRGLPGIGDDAHAIGDYLQAKIEESGAREIRFVGNSMGGYAALMFCAMVGRGKAITFVPQTFICPNKRLQLGDHRYQDKVQALHQHLNATDIVDLKSWISERHPEIEAQVHVSGEDPLDMLHANELNGFGNIAIHRYEQGGGHDLVQWLRDEGALARILKV